MRARWGKFVTESRPLTTAMTAMLERLRQGPVTAQGMEYSTLRGLELRGLARCVSGKSYEIKETVDDNQR